MSDNLENAELSNYEKMIRGMWYDASEGDPELTAKRLNAKDLCLEYNTRIKFTDPEKQQELLKRLLGSFGKNLCIMAPLMVDYGYNIHIGDDVFFNHNTYLMDTAPITIGDRVFVGPNTGFYCAAHPLDAVERAKGLERALPITIGSDVWIGGNAVFMPGVSVGSNVVVGAGAVVTHDIPDNCVAVGNPCKILKELPPIKR
ncbi:MAG: sugar O-acetyltransferase [Proteobacteria bacterium]|uniref:Nodulation protein L n=1 Tax=Candidatus Avisuccinivibrio stercorigallinarum TaxID=2840704 RepID=A0A9D9GT00_9GAMM|nr:sugar O-acetyltransferase [Candidatus Avisuccinivibrio stercorigallinarum]